MNKAFYHKDSEKVHLWIHLLFKANFSQNREEMLGGKPYLCTPGEFTTGRRQLSLETGISESKIERILTNFEKIEQQIAQHKTSRNRLITILHWDEYQQSEQQSEQQVNNNRTTSEQQVNTLKEYKERKKVKKERIFKNSLVANEKFATTGIEIQLSDYLLSFIKNRNGNHKNPNIQQWAKSIDLMIRIDKRDPQQIKEVIQWCQTDEFWQNNILSTKKLRTQYDQLLLKMMAFYNKHSKSKKPIWYDSLKSWYDKKMEEMVDEEE